MGFGLSCTAVGMRPIATCKRIYKDLENELNLSYLELAIGTHINVTDTFDVPLIIHDRALYITEINKERRLDYINFKSDLDIIKDFCNVNEVLGLSLHAPKIYNTTIARFDDKIKRIEDILQLPLYVETMYKDDEWYSNPSNIGKSKLLVDVSHVNIWNNNNKELTEETVNSLLDTYKVGNIHLSDNNGKRDAHDLVKPDLWFNKYLDVWADKYKVTWESLPIEYGYYERLDKRSNNREKLGATYDT